MELVAQQIAKELEQLVAMYHAEVRDQSRQEVIRRGCEYRLGRLWREGNHGLAVHWENQVMGLNCHQNYEGD